MTNWGKNYADLLRFSLANFIYRVSHLGVFLAVFANNSSIYRDVDMESLVSFR